MQTQAANERSRPHAPFGKKEWPRLIPYAGSTSHMRRRAVGSEEKKLRVPGRRNLKRSDLEWFVAEIVAWPSKPDLPLTWENLIAKGAAIRKWEWGRTTLASHKEIADAFAKRAEELRIGRKRVPRSGQATEALKTIARLEANLQQLRVENERYLNRIRLWQKNAHGRGVMLEALDEGWDEVDRGQSDLELRAKKNLSLPKHQPRRPKR